MDRPPVSTAASDERKVMHRIWPCVPHAPEVDCVVAQEAYMRAKNRIVPARKVINAARSR